MPDTQVGTFAPPATADHLFISYPDPDWALAEWLTLRLVTEGYRVWCARFPMLGGDRYPRDVEAAIRERVFCVLALSSRSPVAGRVARERSLAMELASRRRGESLIVVGVDDADPTALGWTTPGLAVLPFHERWDTGCARLVTTLSSRRAPRPVDNGRALAAEARSFLASRRSWHTVL